MSRCHDYELRIKKQRSAAEGETIKSLTKQSGLQPLLSNRSPDI